MRYITLARGAALSSVLLLSGCLLLTSCSAGTSATSSAELAPAAHGPAGAAVNSSASRSLPGGAATQTAKLAPVSQSIIYTASITMRCANVMVTAKQAIGIVTAAGGYTAGEQAVAITSGRSGGTVSLTLKVPVPAYPTVLAALSAPSLGKQLALTQQATDVTQEVANVNSLVTSQQAAISALDGLLHHAASVSQLLQVQQQISADQSSLEALQAQQSALDHETSYATISMTLLGVRHPVAHRQHVTHRGFLAGLATGWRALRHATTWVLTALGAALPFLVIAAILAAAGYTARRRLVRRGPGPTTVD